MAISIQQKVLNEIEKISLTYNYDFVTDPQSPTKGKVYIMNGFSCILSFIYQFSHRDFSITFYEKGQEPVLGKPLLDLSVEKILFHEIEKTETLIQNIDSYLKNLQKSGIAI